MALAEVEIAEGDMMPHLICLSCYSKVEQYHVFKAQIEKSDSILRQELVKSTALESGAQPKTELAATENLADENVCLQLPQPNARLDTMGQVDSICPLKTAQRGHDNVGSTEEFVINSDVSPVVVIKSEEINADRLFLPELSGSNCEVKNSGRTMLHESSDITAENSVCSSCEDLDCVTPDSHNEENGYGVLPYIRSQDNNKDEGGCDDFVFEVVVFSQNDQAPSKDSLSEQDGAAREANAQLNPTVVSSTTVYIDDMKCIPNTNVADITLFIEDDPSASFHCGACKKVFMSQFHLARHKEQAHPNTNMFSSITTGNDDAKVLLFLQKDQAQSKDSSSEVDIADEGNAQLNPFHPTPIPSITTCENDTKVVDFSRKDQARSKESSEVDIADEGNAELNPSQPTIIPSITTCKDDAKVVVFSSQNHRTPSKDVLSEQDVAAQEVNVQLNPVHPTTVSGIKDGIEGVVFSQNDQAQSENSSRGQHTVAHDANAQLSPIPPTILSNVTTYKSDTMAIPNTNVTDTPTFIKDDLSALFPCDVCKKVFMSHFYLVTHKEQAHQKPRLECDVCKINFSSKYTLRTHKKLHIDDQLYRCEVCLETFEKSSQLSAHKLTHKQNFVCKLCGMAFVERKIYIEHRIKHKKEMTHVCTRCKKAFADTTALYLHSTIHSVDKRQYTCPDCGDLFHQRSYLVRHHKRRHQKTISSALPTLNTGGEVRNSVENLPNILENREDAVQKISSNVDTASETKTSISIGDQNTAFVCYICGKRTASKLKMASHMRVHTGERPYKCDLCPKAYKEIGHLTYHLTAQHEKLSFKCNLCEKVFRTSVSFSQHQVKHGAVKAHACAHCKRAFYSDYELEIHNLTHTELKSYKCKECGALLRTKRYYEHHFRSFHKGILITYPHPDPSDIKFSIPATEEDLTCIYCGKRFSCRSKVMDHTRIHTGERPYVCNVCNKTYTQQGHLTEHSRAVHNNVTSPYCCDTCGAVFKVRTTFQLHQLKHDGVKPHICAVCDNAFYTSYLLKRHVRSAHDEKGFSCQFCDCLFHSKSILIRHLRQLHKVKISKIVPC